MKGIAEEPVQGWANRPWRPVPTALYEWRTAGTSRRVFVIYPAAAGEACPVKARWRQFGGWETDAHCALVELDVSGKAARRVLCLGERIERVPSK